MKTALCLFAGASLAFLAGCASSSDKNTPVVATLPTTMNTPYSSDFFGLQQEEVGAPRGAYLPPAEMDFSQLPQPVQATIVQQTRGAFIDKIIRQTRQGQTVYKVELRPQSGQIVQGILVVASDGTLLKERYMGEAAGANLPPVNPP